MIQEIDRKPQVFKPLQIPKQLQKDLPFKDKPKVAKTVVDEVQKKRIGVVRSKKEANVSVCQLIFIWINFLIL